MEWEVSGSNKQRLEIDRMNNHLTEHKVLARRVLDLQAIFVELLECGPHWRSFFNLEFKGFLRNGICFGRQSIRPL